MRPLSFSSPVRSAGEVAASARPEGVSRREERVMAFRRNTPSVGDYADTSPAKTGEEDQVSP